MQYKAIVQKPLLFNRTRVYVLPTLSLIHGHMASIRIGGTYESCLYISRTSLVLIKASVLASCGAFNTHGVDIIIFVQSYAYEMLVIVVYIHADNSTLDSYVLCIDILRF
jgi:hypothetical protein